MKDISQYSGKIAIPTIILSLFLFVAHIVMFVYCLIGFIPIIVGVLTNTILCSYMYTVHHEATHGNISGRKPGFKWLDDLFGKTAAAFMDLSFTVYSRAHIAHHKYANSSRDTVVDAHFDSIWGNAGRYLKAIKLEFKQKSC